MVGEVAKSFQEDSSFPLQNPRLRIRAALHLCSEKLHQKRMEMRKAMENDEDYLQSAPVSFVKESGAFL